MYQTEKERVKNLFETSPFTIDSLKNLENHSSKLWAKFRHIENVANLMEKAADLSNFSDREKVMAFTAGQFHDIACFNDIALTGKEYGPKHGERGAVITYGILTMSGYFSTDEIKTISTAIANHDGATTAELEGFAKILTSLLRDCDKIDCYRRQSTEPLSHIFQRPLEFDASVRQEFALDCLAGKPMKYADMRNFNEEILLYMGWFFQLQNPVCQKIAIPLFKDLAERFLSVTENLETKRYIKNALEKAQKI